MKELREIISGSRTRGLFERFLVASDIWGIPARHHSKDIQKLDAFICALHRYRSHLEVDALESWLTETKLWPRVDAEWTCARIRTGLQVLCVDRRF
jgi:hypothetical protein